MQHGRARPRARKCIPAKGPGSVVPSSTNRIVLVSVCKSRAVATSSSLALFACTTLCKGKTATAATMPRVSHCTLRIDESFELPLFISVFP